MKPMDVKTKEDFLSFADQLLGESLIEFNTRKYADKIRNGEDAEGIEALAWLQDVNYRRKFTDQIIDYRNYKIGDKLPEERRVRDPDYDKLIKCPYCGKAGILVTQEKSPPSMEVAHIIRSFPMGSTLLLVCKSESKIQKYNSKTRIYEELDR